ncbi:MAG TPA: hypothetical protein VIM31_01560 [Candidatus Microsaccharimonas sp.]|jgi:hypothetical protein
MSQKKHLHVLSELSTHPIARNIEWADLIPALSSIGILHSEANGNYDFTRNEHTIVFERSHNKTLEVADVLKLRHFLKLSAQSPDDDALNNTEIVAVDHHNATVVHNPGTANEVIEKFHADLSKGRMLHQKKQSPPFHDENPTDDSAYFDAIIKSMMKSQRIVILSHGTGSSSAGEKLFTLVDDSYPKVAHKIVAVQKCDLEAMTEPELIALGTELLNGTADVISA